MHQAHEIRRPALVRTDGNRQWLRMPRPEHAAYTFDACPASSRSKHGAHAVVPTVPVGFEQIVELPKSEIGMVSGEIAQSFDPTPRRPFVAASTDTPVSDINTASHARLSLSSCSVFKYPIRLSPQRGSPAFFSISPFNARFSKLISAYIAFSFAFSSSSSRSLLISLAVIPPYFASPVEILRIRDRMLAAYLSHASDRSPPLSISPIPALH